MINDKELYAEFLQQIEDETIEEPVSLSAPTEINEPVQETDIISETTDLQPNQDIQVSISNTQQQYSIAQSVLNYASGNAICIGKYVQIPNYPTFAYICNDINYNNYLCILNQQTNQDYCIGNIILETSGEYAVYQSYQKIGTLSYNSLSDPVWQLVPIGMNIPQQRQNNQHQAQNNHNFKYVFNNVPPENPSQIIGSIIKCNPQNSIEVNFAPPTIKSGSPFIPLDEFNVINLKQLLNGRENVWNA